MNICYLYNGHPLLIGTGGIGARMRLLSQRLIRDGHDVTFVGSYNGVRRKQILIDEGVQIIALPYIRIPKLHRYFNRVMVARFIQRLHKLKPFDLIEMPEYLGWYLPDKISAVKILRFSSSSGKIRYGISSNWWLPYLEKHIDRADYYCSVSKDIADAARETHKSLAGKDIKVIYSGVDTQIFKPGKTLEQKTIRLLYFGSITRNKGVFDLIAAWNKISSELTGISLTFCGADGHDSKLNNSTIDLLRAMLNEDASDNLEFCVKEDRFQLAKLIQESSIVVIPSHAEGFSNAVLEAMACGKPVVYTRVGSAKEIITDGINGILCNIADYEDIYIKILYLIENPELRREIGQSAFITVKNHFNQDVFLENNINFYRECISLKKSVLVGS